MVDYQSILASCASRMTQNNQNRINKSDFDKTLIGWVSENITRENGEKYWRIQTNGTAYDIKHEMSNITEVGQRVRLFIPNHDYKDKYAEVIDENAFSHPVTAVYNDSNNSITETWKLKNGKELTRVYNLTIINKNTKNEEVTEIGYPDGSKMTLRGFVTGE